MWNNIFTLALLIIGVWSCKKDNVSYIPEDNIHQDTLTFCVQKNINYISSNEININLKMLTLIGLNSETSYNSNDKIIFHLNQIYPFFKTINNSQTITTETSNSNYTALLLFENNQKNWYSKNNIGFYLKRFLINNIATNNISIAYFTNQNLSPIYFTPTQNNTIINKDWKDNIDFFYAQNKKDTYFNNTIILNNVLNKLDEAIDKLSTLTTPNKSITLFNFTPYINNTLSTTLINNIITKAILNQIQINAIGYNNEYFRRITQATGGFIIENEYSEPFYGQKDYDEITNFGMAMENINTLLKKNYTTHNYNITLLDTTNSNSLVSGFETNTSFTYKQNQYYVKLKIP